MDEEDFKKDHEYIDPLWNLADTLSVVQAAALIAGFEPNSIRFNVHGDVYFENEHGTTDAANGRSVKTAFEALKNAISSGKLNAITNHDVRSVDDALVEESREMAELNGMRINFKNSCDGVIPNSSSCLPPVSLRTGGIEGGW